MQPLLRAFVIASRRKCPSLNYSRWKPKISDHFDCPLNEAEKKTRLPVMFELQQLHYPFKTFPSSGRKTIYRLVSPTREKKKKMKNAAAGMVGLMGLNRDFHLFPRFSKNGFWTCSFLCELSTFVSSSLSNIFFYFQLLFCFVCCFFARVESGGRHGKKSFRTAWHCCHKTQ